MSIHSLIFNYQLADIKICDFREIIIGYEILNVIMGEGRWK